ncbi:hypothetical protein C1646_694496 [Rhizophagus diaphanus]|nr:hypothetical protein C1646_694496 [Rhizophagus diaphanus] [Rhizophagus sp. MUCL 43196]
MERRVGLKCLEEMAVIMFEGRKPEEKYNVDCLVPTFKSGRKGVMVWDVSVYLVISSSSS